MIKFERQCSISRYCLGTLLILCLMTPLLAGKAGGEAAKKHSQWLKTVRGGLHGNYSSIVFEFDSKFSFQQPVVKEQEVNIVFQDTGTAVTQFRRYKDFDSWLRLEKEGNNLRARIGIPKDFPQVTHSIMKEPERLVLRFSQKNIVLGTQEVTSQQMLKSGLSEAATPPPTQNEGLAKAHLSLDALQRKSYNYVDLDIRQALSALAQDQEVNVIMSPEVTGKISVHLNQVTLEEAIRSIALAGGFTYRKEGNGFYVYKPKLSADPQAEQLRVRVFRLKYAAIDKVQEILTAIPGIHTVRLHEPSKTIVVEDTQENIAKIEEIIKNWDVAPKQVLIEARIMQVNLTDDMSLGVDWQKVFGDLTIGTSGGFVSPGIGLTANLVTATGTPAQFTAALKALQTKTQVNTLSTPKILALHGKPSRVQVGGRQGYKTNTFTPTGTTENISFLDTGTILDITPYIDDEGNVLLEVRPQINSVTLDAAGIPSQKTTTVSTSMMAKNGQTMFIGGLIEDTKTGTRNLIPFLGHIPVLGLLFGQSQEGIGKSELIILITPQIINLEKPNAEGLEKTKQMEEKLKKEPRPLTERLFKNLQ